MMASVKRILVTLIVLALTLAVSAQVTLAATTGGTTGGAGKSAPEAPHAMLLPLFGVLAIAAIWVLLARLRTRRRVAADEAI